MTATLNDQTGRRKRPEPSAEAKAAAELVRAAKETARLVDDHEHRSRYEETYPNTAGGRVPISGPSTPPGPATTPPGSSVRQGQ
ncbi:hypothetical protein B0E53_00731 [Micromonospora sp. MH33]|nr:hypothetical protein B0E53_00731 [Micromonospora sp. MH33]